MATTTSSKLSIGIDSTRLSAVNTLFVDGIDVSTVVSLSSWIYGGSANSDALSELLTIISGTEFGLNGVVNTAIDALVVDSVIKSASPFKVSSKTFNRTFGLYTMPFAVGESVMVIDLSVTDSTVITNPLTTRVQVIAVREDIDARRIEVRYWTDRAGAAWGAKYNLECTVLAAIDVTEFETVKLNTVATDVGAFMDAVPTITASNCSIIESSFATRFSRVYDVGFPSAGGMSEYFNSGAKLHILNTVAPVIVMQFVRDAGDISGDYRNEEYTLISDAVKFIGVIKIIKSGSSYVIEDHAAFQEKSNARYAITATQKQITCNITPTGVLFTGANVTIGFVESDTTITVTISGNITYVPIPAVGFVNDGQIDILRVDVTDNDSEYAVIVNTGNIKPAMVVATPENTANLDVAPFTLLPDPWFGGMSVYQSVNNLTLPSDKNVRLSVSLSDVPSNPLTDLLNSVVNVESNTRLQDYIINNGIKVNDAVVTYPCDILDGVIYETTGTSDATRIRVTVWAQLLTNRVIQYVVQVINPNQYVGSLRNIRVILEITEQTVSGAVESTTLTLDSLKLRYPRMMQQLYEYDSSNLSVRGDTFALYYNYLLYGAADDADIARVGLPVNQYPNLHKYVCKFKNYVRPYHNTVKSGEQITTDQINVLAREVYNLSVLFKQWTTNFSITVPLSVDMGATVPQVTDSDLVRVFKRLMEVLSIIDHYPDFLDWIEHSVTDVLSTPNDMVGDLWYWGGVTHGYISTNTELKVSSPTMISSTTKWKNIAVGYNNILALDENNMAWTWGVYGDAYENKSHLSSPIQVGAMTEWKMVSTGFNTNTFGIITTDDKLWKWGGDATNPPTQLYPDVLWKSVAVTSIPNNATTSVLFSAVNGIGEFWCMGLPYVENPSEFVQVGNSRDWDKVFLGTDNVVGVFGLLIKTDGTLWGWGSNYYGQLGNGLVQSETPNSISSPIQIGTSGNWVNISVGCQHIIGLQRDGTLWGWGHNVRGKVGLGYASNTITTPTQITSFNTWKQISAGGDSSIALKNDGTLWGWGSNASGELGLGVSISQALVPTKIGTGNNWLSVSRGVRNTYAIMKHVDESTVPTTELPPTESPTETPSTPVSPPNDAVSLQDTNWYPSQLLPMTTTDVIYLDNDSSDVVLKYSSPTTTPINPAGTPHTVVLKLYGSVGASGNEPTVDSHTVTGTTISNTVVSLVVSNNTRYRTKSQYSVSIGSTILGHSRGQLYRFETLSATYTISSDKSFATEGENIAFTVTRNGPTYANSPVKLFIKIKNETHSGAVVKTVPISMGYGYDTTVYTHTVDQADYLSSGTEYTAHVYKTDDGTAIPLSSTGTIKIFNAVTPPSTTPTI